MQDDDIEILVPAMVQCHSAVLVTACFLLVLVVVVKETIFFILFLVSYLSIYSLYICYY